MTISDHCLPEAMLTEAELKKQIGKTRRHLRLRELLIEHSAISSFIVMTLPMPREVNNLYVPYCLAHIPRYRKLSASLPCRVGDLSHLLKVKVL